jgi:anti-sigma regulatory factor (Ser/Thr protein kinase)
MRPDPQAATNGSSSSVSARASVPVEVDDLGASQPRRARVIDTLGDPRTECAEFRVGLDTGAPAVARAAVADRLKNAVAAAALADARLVVSELVTNSVCHSGASTDEALTLRVELSASMLRLEVEDPGRDGAIAPRPPDIDGGGGRGLNLVQTISERWGVERVAAGGTRVWAQLALRPG